ncbi:AAA family ATPase [Botrimarina sp.]|uniref:AAA family ATPase n=1 Tax=Botrimarina sp. TaxID=2795802 RepID=UPI0032EEA372
MKLTEIHVDGFGVWHDLQMRDLSSGVTVVYGPNEAGKTTLMHFLRSMLYGVTAERRERYLPPRSGGRPGGSLGLLSDDGPFRAARYVERGEGDLGRVVVTLPDGEEQGDRLLREGLESVDEATYCNVFAIGLDEINELGALDGAEAARWIYRLTSGLDRVSLYDVIQELRTSRRRLLAPAGEPSRIADLIARRDRLQTEIEQLAVDARRWSKLAVELDETSAQSEQLEAQLKETERRARRIEIALGLKPMWAERERVREDRTRLDGLPDLGEKPLERLEELNTKAEEHQRRRDTIRGQRRELHQEARELGVNEALVRSCCRLDALAEQQDWLDSLERQLGELGEEAERLEARVEAEAARLAKLWRHKPDPEAAPELDEEVLETLEPSRQALHDAERVVAEAKRERDALVGHQRDYDAQLQTALTSGEKLGLPADIEQAGELVALLRGRQKAEQKVDQAQRSVRDLEERRVRLAEGQVLPTEIFLLLTALFASAVVLVFGNWVAPGWLGDAWWLLGLITAGACWLVRHQWEENRAQEFDACQQQLEVAKRQVDKAIAERKELDKELPLAEGAASIRLEHAEKHLEELERMLPVEAERRKANQKATAADEYYRAAKEELAQAQQQWREALRAVGLPDETTASEIDKLAGQHQALAELRSRLEAKQEEAERCEREHEKLSKRILALAEETDLVLEEADLGEQLGHLLTERRLQQGRIDHRKKLRERSLELKEKEQKHAAAAERIEADRLSLFQRAGVDGEQAFRQVVADLEEAARLDERVARLSREITAAIGASGTEQDYADLMSREGLLTLDGVWAEITAEHESIEKRLRELAARRAVVDKERQAMVEDTSLADKRIEIDLVEAQLVEANEQWRERAAVGAMLELIRSDYEQHRQPETLQEASRYLERLTRGRYPRVWTPLADDVLLVDTVDGESLPVDQLSRGTREQLYLSVRMALVATFARRGVRLPMVLDDVLVNFDNTRARIAAGVLAQFAAEGHQLLVFTCHEHVYEMFKELGVDLRRLPSREGDPEPELDPSAEAMEEAEPEAEESPAPEPPAAEPAARRKKRRKLRPRSPQPEPWVEADYLPLAPVTEVRRRLVTIDTPATPESATAEPVPPEALDDSQEFVYGAATADESDATPYGAAPRGPYRRQPPSPEEAEERWVYSEAPFAEPEEPASATWLDEAEQAWAEAIGPRA